MCEDIQESAEYASRCRPWCHLAEASLHEQVSDYKLKSNYKSSTRLRKQQHAATVASDYKSVPLTIISPNLGL